MNLKNVSLDEFAGMFINYTQAVEEFYRLCHGDSTGNTISLLFNPHRLDTRTSFEDGRSVYESLQDDNILSGLARLYLYYMEHGSNNAFYQTMQRGYQGIQFVKEFPPSACRDVLIAYAKHNDGEVLNVLDPCCGWGGRMIGVASLNRKTHYYGYEPSTRTYEGLLKLGEWLKELNPSFEFTIYCKPYEDAYKLEKRFFDISLTSPPYFNTEQYSREKTNSLNRYGDYKKWEVGFYEPLIHNTVEALKDDSSIFCLNVSSKKYPLYEDAKKICAKYGYSIFEIKSYLAGDSEKFYLISRKKLFTDRKRLF
jgi:hypothetical protein